MDRTMQKKFFTSVVIDRLTKDEGWMSIESCYSTETLTHKLWLKEGKTNDKNKETRGSGKSNCNTDTQKSSRLCSAYVSKSKIQT